MSRYVARINELVVEELDGGLVVYDTRSGQAHWLDAGASAVWRACAEPRELEAICALSGLPSEAAQTSLDHLAEIGLLEDSHGDGISRRIALRRVAKIGAAGVVAAPIISTVIPVAAAHASTGTQNTGGPGGSGGAPTFESGGVFYLPAGCTVTFSGIVLSGCDYLALGYNETGFTALSNNGGYECSSYTDSNSYAHTASGGSGETFTVDLESSNGYGVFDFPSTNPNHALVTGSGNQYTVYFTDDGGYGCDSNCSDRPPSSGFYNAKVDLTFTCPV